MDTLASIYIYCMNVFYTFANADMTILDIDSLYVVPSCAKDSNLGENMLIV